MATVRAAATEWEETRRSDPATRGVSLTIATRGVSLTIADFDEPT